MSGEMRYSFGVVREDVYESIYHVLRRLRRYDLVDKLRLMKNNYEIVSGSDIKDDEGDEYFYNHSRGESTYELPVLKNGTFVAVSDDEDD